MTVALEAAERAYEKKKCHYEVWKLLIECYKRLGDKRRLLTIEGVASRVYRFPVDVPIEKAELAESLALLSLAMGLPNLAPYVLGRARFGADGIEAPPGVFLGEFLPSFQEPADGWRYWSGVLVDRERLHAKAMLLEVLKETTAFPLAEDGAFVFDIMRAREIRSPLAIGGADAAELDGAQADDVQEGFHDVIVPLAGTEARQEVVFRRGQSDTWQVGHELLPPQRAHGNLFGVAGHPRQADPSWTQPASQETRAAHPHRRPLLARDEAP